LFSVAISLAKPSRFDWRTLPKLDLITESSSTTSPTPSITQPNTDPAAVSDISDPEKRPTQISNDHPTPSPTDLDDVIHPMSPETLHHIDKWLRIASIFFVVNFVVTMISWPLPLYKDYISTRSFFGGWVTVAIIWHFAAIGAVIIYPCWDARETIEISVGDVVGEVRQLWSSRT
jgi:hypothetical protein